MRVMLLSVAVLGAGVAQAVTAEPLAVAPDSRVRVTAPGAVKGRVVGRLVASDDASLTIALAGQTIVLPRAEVTRVEVSRRLSRRGRGLAIGLLVGGAGGALVGYGAGTHGERTCFTIFLPSADDCRPGERFDHRGDDAAALGVLMGTLGAGLGAALSPGEKWDDAGRGGVAVGLAPAPIRGGAALSLTLRF